VTPLAFYLLWQHRVLPAVLVGFGPPIVVSLGMLKWTPDLEKLKRSAFGRYVGKYMTPFMQVIRLLTLFGSLLVVSVAAPAQIGAKPKSDVRLTEGTDPKFRVGDVWEYKTRQGEEHSRVTIVKIDSSPELGMIVHVGVDNLTWKDCQNNPMPESVAHMPFACKAVDASVTRRIATDHTLPDYHSGYEEWKEAYSKKHAGIYVIAIQDAVSVAEKTYRSGIGCESNAESTMPGRTLR
jgi:hypothetical protein